MFEYVDEKLGRVKVINVTEARASMATIMGDKDCNYIITKNNRPIRVVIHYETFKKSQVPSRLPSAKASDPLARELQLKGIIESKEKDLKKQLREASLQEASLQETSLQETLPPDAFVAESSLPEPNEVLVPSLQEEPPMERSMAKVDSNPLPKMKKPLPEPSHAEPAADEGLTWNLNTPPPSDDYFDRFKKLYEPAAAAKQAQVPSPSYAPARAPNRTVVGGPPSIQELLMDLEREKLSTEDDLLNSAQVNHLLNRMQGK